MARLKRHKWLPALLEICGIAIYVYDGLEMNSWIKNLPNIIIYFVIVAALWWALRKKDKIMEKYKQ